MGVGGTLVQCVDLYGKYKQEAGKAVVGLDHVKEALIVALFTKIPTTISEQVSRRTSAGLVSLLGIPGGGKTYLASVIAQITKTTLGRIQGRVDLLPADIVGALIWNPKTGEFEEHPGVITYANVLILDEINRIHPKSQSAFLEAFQERRVTIGDKTFELPELSFGIATANPVETGEGTYPLSAALTDRFIFQVEVGYPTLKDECELVQFDISKVDILQLISEEGVIQAQHAIQEEVRLDERTARYIARLVRATRPLSSRAASALIGKEACVVVDGHRHYKKPEKPSPSRLVEEFVELGAGPRASIYWSKAAKTRALLVGERDVVYPEDVQAIARLMLSHRIYLNPQAQGVSVDTVINDILRVVPV